MFLSLLLAKCIFNLSSQSCKNIIIGRCIIMGSLFLIYQCDIYQRHQRNGMFTFASLICLSIGIVTLSDELSCGAVKLLFITFDDNLDLFIVNV